MTRHPDTNSLDRYFYNDPLAAAWMAKHFGMMFSIMHYGKFVADPIFFDGKWEPAKTAEEVMDFDPDVALYVHPDSLHLLKPQKGDLVAWSHAGYLTHHEGKTPYTVGGIGTVPVQRLDAVTEGEQTATVIQRNGVAFHWPEREAV